VITFKIVSEKYIFFKFKDVLIFEGSSFLNKTVHLKKTTIQ